MNTKTQEALKMALNAMANKMESDNHGNPLTKYDEELQRAMDAGVEALAQPQPKLFLDLSSSNGNHPVQQEPVAWMSGGGVLTKLKSEAQLWVTKGGSAIPLYTHPAPAREWQGLSDDKIDYMWEILGDVKKFARAIEQAHGIGVSDESN